MIFEAPRFLPGGQRCWQRVNFWLQSQLIVLLSGFQSVLVSDHVSLVDGIQCSKLYVYRVHHSDCVHWYGWISLYIRTGHLHSYWLSINKCTPPFELIEIVKLPLTGEKVQPLLWWVYFRNHIIFAFPIISQLRWCRLLKSLHVEVICHLHS